MPSPVTMRSTLDSMELRLRAEGNAFYSRQDLIDAYNDGIEELAETTGYCERFGTIPFVANQRLYDVRPGSSLQQPAGTVVAGDFGFTPSEFTKLSLLDGNIQVTEGVKSLSVGFGSATDDLPWATGFPWSEFLYPTHCWNPQTSRWLIPVSVPDLQRLGGPDWRSTKGEPYYYYQQGQWNVGLFPAPNVSANIGKDSTTNIVILFFCALPTRMISEMESPIGLPEEYCLGGEEWALYDLQCQEAEYKRALRNLDTYNKIEARLKLEVSRLRLAQNRVLGVAQMPGLVGRIPFGGF